MNCTEIDYRHMQRAIEIARNGEGSVEPNPQVGCVIAAGENVLSEGWHQKFGAPHAEVDAIEKLAPGVDLSDATLYVTLEPCCHTGKTPPCTDAILQLGIKRVVVGVEDPFPAVSGRGIDLLRQAGVEVHTGAWEEAGRQLLAPYLKLQQLGQPWIIAKWAMTLDGKLATATGDSQWISGTESREIVHQIRGRVDGILVGSQTALADDPLLTARPPGPRRAHRLIFDSQAVLATQFPECQLAQTASNTPLLLFASCLAAPDRIETLEASGVEVVTLSGATHQKRLAQMLDELGNRQMTNVLVEGGAGLLGLLWDTLAINEVHAFIAPKVIGGADAPSAIHGGGFSSMSAAKGLIDPIVKEVGQDIYVHGRVSP